MQKQYVYPYKKPVRCVIMSGERCNSPNPRPRLPGPEVAAQPTASLLAPTPQPAYLISDDDNHRLSGPCDIKAGA